MSITIRPSHDGDVGAITAIYGNHVLHGTASFEEVPPEPDEIARRRREVIACGLPHLVAERSGRVLGFCFAGRYHTRPGYRFTVEDSIYVDAAEVGRGVGRALLTSLLERCTEQGYRQMVAVIGSSDNRASIGLHQSLGFARIGVLGAIGFKFGRWVDIVLMQRALGSGANTPPIDVRSSIEEVSMAEAFADPALVRGYHAHLYYAPETRPIAERLRAAIGERFPGARVGSWHDEPVGPHPVSMYQVAFTVEEFPLVVPWLMLNREALNILVHPLTDDSVADHTQFAVWLGSPLPLRTEVLRRGPRPG